MADRMEAVMVSQLLLVLAEEVIVEAIMRAAAAVEIIAEAVMRAAAVVEAPDRMDLSLKDLYRQEEAYGFRRHRR